MARSAPPALVAVSEDVELKFELHPAQLEVFQSLARFIVLVAGRRFGKSYLACIRAICSATDPANTKRKPVWIIAPVFSQAKQTYWQLLLDLAAPLITNANVNEGTISLFNGVQIAIKGSDRPDTLRGIGLYDCILDEFASMKPEVWESIIRPALSDVRGRALFIGTPAGRNHFFLLYEAAVEDESGEWAAFRFNSLANPYLPEGEVEAARRTMSSAIFRQEYMASFETGGGSIFLPAWFIHEPTEPPKGDYLVTADFAGFEEVANANNSRLKRLDRTAIPVVKIHGDDEWWVRDFHMGRWGPKETAKRIVDILADEEIRPRAFGMEKGALYNAIMPYIKDEAMGRPKAVHLNPQALSHENKSKVDRITWALAGRFEHGKIKFRTAGWNNEVEDEFIHFPSKLVHDDAPDALAYIEQLARLFVLSDFDERDEEDPYWEPVDPDFGF